MGIVLDYKPTSKGICTSAQDLLQQLPIIYIYILIRDMYDRQSIHSNRQWPQAE